MSNPVTSNPFTSNGQRLAAHLRRTVWHYSVNRFAASHVWPATVRRRIYRRLGLRTAGLVHPGCSFSGPKVFFGPEAAVGADCVLDEEFAPIRLGRHAALSPRVSLITTTHQIGLGPRNSGPVTGKEIRIGPDAWICYGAIVMPGVTVGEGCIVGVGAVVTQDCEPHGYYAGNPAVRVRNLPVRRKRPADAAARSRDRTGVA